MEVSSSAIEDIATSTPVCLIDNANKHWGGINKIFCFYYLFGVGFFISDFNHLGPQGSNLLGKSPQSL